MTTSEDINGSHVKDAIGSLHRPKDKLFVETFCPALQPLFPPILFNLGGGGGGLYLLLRPCRKTCDPS